MFNSNCVNIVENSSDFKPFKILFPIELRRNHFLHLLVKQKALDLPASHSSSRFFHNIRDCGEKKYSANHQTANTTQLML